MNISRDLGGILNGFEEIFQDGKYSLHRIAVNIT